MAGSTDGGNDLRLGKFWGDDGGKNLLLATITAPWLLTLVGFTGTERPAAAVWPLAGLSAGLGWYVFQRFCFPQNAHVTAKVKANAAGAFLFTGVAGFVLLLTFQRIAAAVPAQPGGYWLYQLIHLVGEAYRNVDVMMERLRTGRDAAEIGLVQSFFLFLVPAICEELVKLLPVLYLLEKKREADTLQFRDLLFVGCASGLGFGVSEGVFYSFTEYLPNKIPLVWFLVRFFGVAYFHAVWTSVTMLVIWRASDVAKKKSILRGSGLAAVLAVLGAVVLPAAVVHSAYNATQGLLGLAINVAAVCVVAKYRQSQLVVARNLAHEDRQDSLPANKPKPGIPPEHLSPSRPLEEPPRLPLVALPVEDVSPPPVPPPICRPEFQSSKEKEAKRWGPRPGMSEPPVTRREAIAIWATVGILIASFAVVVVGVNISERRPEKTTNGSSPSSTCSSSETSSPPVLSPGKPSDAGTRVPFLGPPEESEPKLVYAPARPLLDEWLAAYQTARTYSDRGVMRFYFATPSGLIEKTVPAATKWAAPNRLRLELVDAVVACDGQNYFARSDRLPNQIVKREAPRDMLGAAACRDLLLAGALPMGPIQLMLLTEPYESAEFLATKAVLFSPEKIDGWDHDRIAVGTPEHLSLLFVNHHTHILRRADMDLDKEMLAWVVDYFRITEPVVNGMVTCDFEGAQLNQPTETDALGFEEPRGVETLSSFVPRHPAQYLSKPCPEFSLQTELLSPITRASIAGKVVAIHFWFSQSPSSLQVLEADFQTYKDDNRCVIVAVNADSPLVSADAVWKVARDAGLTMPVCRNRQCLAAFNLDQSIPNVANQPASVFIGPTGCVEDVELPASGRIKEKVGHLLAGDHLFDQGIEKYGAQLKNLAEWAVTSVLPPKKPTVFGLRYLWSIGGQESPGKVTMPGNILAVSGNTSGSGIYVVDRWRTVVELYADGHVRKTHFLDLPDEVIISVLRTGITRKGRRYFAAFAPHHPQVHVFDDEWKKVLTYPLDPNRDSRPIGDVQLADLCGDGNLLVCISRAFASGVETVALDGTGVWDVRSIDCVGLAVSSPESSGKRSLFCVGAGKSFWLDCAGNRKGEVETAAGWLDLAVSTDVEGDEQPELAGVGLDKAIGLNLRGDRLWELKLPTQLSNTGITPIVGGRSSTGRGYWLVATSTGRINVLNSSGGLVDSFGFGKALSGLAVTVLDGKDVILVASKDGVAAYQILPAQNRSLP